MVFWGSEDIYIYEYDSFPHCREFAIHGQVPVKNWGIGSKRL